MMDLTALSEKLVSWFDEPEHYSVVQFAADHKMSKKRIFAYAAESAEFAEALDYAFTVQEFKVTEGAMSGALDRSTALKMLETYSGWKSDVSVYQNVGTSLTAEQVEGLTKALEAVGDLKAKETEFVLPEGFGEVEISVSESAVA